MPDKVSYFYDSAVGDHAYEVGHPMKPFRVRLTHSLVLHYKLHKKMEVYRAQRATPLEMTQFHSDDYINFLNKVTPDNMKDFPGKLDLHNLGADSPIFDGLFQFCSLSAGGSMEGAARLNRKKCDVAINWAGGLHHAKKNEASGFCYVNDAVLGILELLRFHKRVLYIDIDVHHGDGVEEAFYTTDRVMTVSLHKFGEFFPGTGELSDIGIGKGKYHSVNVPLRDGMDDVSYKGIFEPIITAVMKYYQPEAVVLQCGADSLSGDRLGPFNLSMAGHAACVTFVQSFNLPLLVLGGGGYTVKNVARTWAFETGKLLNVDMDPAIPFSEYYEHYGPNFELDVRPSNMLNSNSPEYLQRMVARIVDQLRCINPSPSVEMTSIPNGLAMDDEAESRMDDEDEDANKDVRNTVYRLDKRVENPNELEDSDDEDGIAEVAYNLQQKGLREKMARERNRTDTDEERAKSLPNSGYASLSPPTIVSEHMVATSTAAVPTPDETRDAMDLGETPVISSKATSSTPAPPSPKASSLITEPSEPSSLTTPSNIPTPSTPPVPFPPGAHALTTKSEEASPIALTSFEREGNSPNPTKPAESPFTTPAHQDEENQDVVVEDVR